MDREGAQMVGKIRSLQSALVSDVVTVPILCSKLLRPLQRNELSLRVGAALRIVPPEMSANAFATIKCGSRHNLCRGKHVQRGRIGARNALQLPYRYQRSSQLGFFTFNPDKRRHDPPERRRRRKRL